MTTTNDPEVFRSRWHQHINEIEALKMSLHPERFEDLEESLDELHDIVDYAADAIEEEP